jgi:hypothetical protein
MEGSEALSEVSQRPPPTPGLWRFEELLQLLSAQLRRFSWGSVRENELDFAGCIPLLSELDRLGHTVPNLPSEEIRALTRTASWHLRALAGLANTPTVDEQDHASSAREALGELARLVGLPEEPRQGAGGRATP